MQRKNIRAQVAGISILLLLASCGQQRDYKQLSRGNEPTKEATTEYIESADSVSFSSDISQLTSSSRKVISTADFECRTSNIYQTVNSLEAVVKAVGGVIEHSETTRDIFTTKEIVLQNDSIKKVQVYQARATLTLRVPSSSLDTLTDIIPAITSFINHRRIAQKDATLSYLSNALKNKNTETSTMKNHADKLARRSKDVTATDEYVNRLDDNKVDRTIANLDILDKVNYATITIQLTEPPGTDVFMEENTDLVAVPTYVQRLASSFISGWNIIVNLSLLLIRIWPLVLVGIIVAICHRKYRRKIFSSL